MSDSNVRNNQNTEGPNYLIWLFAALVIVLTIWLGFLIFWLQFNDSKQSAGDIFLAFSGLFSGWAFVGVFINVWIQMNELKITRDELKKQSENLRESAELQAYSVLLSSQIDKLNIWPFYKEGHPQSTKLYDNIKTISSSIKEKCQGELDLKNEDSEDDNFPSDDYHHSLV